MLSKIDSKILDKYYNRRAQNEPNEEAKVDNRADADGNANNGKLISTK